MHPKTKFVAPALVALVGLLAAAPLEAQRFPGFGGVEGRVGAALPDAASTGLSASVDVDLGYIGTPFLRPIVGFNFFQANVRDRAFGADRATGSLSATGVRVGARLDLFGVAGLRPYLLGAVTGHNITVDGDTEAQRELLRREFGGFVVGGSLGAGAGYSLDAEERFLATAEVRRVWNANVPHWGAEVGVRIVPRGRAAYDPVFRFRDTWDRGGTQAAVEAERLRLERERLERERLAAEDAARRAEQDRLARMTDEERRRAQQEADDARRRAEQEAAARVGAEADAARARADAERARAETAEAQRRAREAEEQLYQRLLDLDRLIANVTEIRETERGLSIVLGQGLFAVGQSALSPRARDEVGRIAAVLAQFPQHRISVEGHTDATGSAAANQRLSEQRASSVRAALDAAGIDMGRIDMLGHGQDLPIADNATVAGRAQNRRVEIVLLGARRPAAAVN
jgi:outer membrane protein OmpA-like peptidoglycan-associated protein